MTLDRKLNLWKEMKILQTKKYEDKFYSLFTYSNFFII